MLGYVAVAWGGEPVEGWKVPPPEILAVLEAPELPIWPSRVGDAAVLELRPVRYPPLADLAAPFHKLAGVRVDPGRHGRRNPAQFSDPAIRGLDGRATPIPLPPGTTVVDWAANVAGDRVAFVLRTPEAFRLALWADGRITPVDLDVNGVLGDLLQWMPDQRTLLVKAVPEGLGAPPERPEVPAGPFVASSSGARASSTYESRDLLVDAHDDALFSHFAASRIALVGADGAVRTVGSPDVYGDVSPSPSGEYLLVERLRGPWSHRVVWAQFARDVEVWRAADGGKVATLASLPAAEQIPIHGVPTGLRDAGWRQDAPATVAWLDALDGGDWSVEVPHRDRLVALAAPFTAAPTELLRAPHRIEGVWWGADGLLVVQQFERARRWRHVWLADADDGPESARPWFDLSVNDRYADPGSPVQRRTPTGAALLDQEAGALFFAGSGSTPEGDRPFLDRRPLAGPPVRLWRSGADELARFVRFVGDDHGALLIERQSPASPPNLATLDKGKPKKGVEGLAWRETPVTAVVDPTPQLRGVTRRTVTYARADGVPLSFVLYTPPGWKEGDAPLPTVVQAYPREYSDPATAGQITGSDQTFVRIGGPSALFFALHGYAVLDNVTMPVLGDPDTAYDTFVAQLVSSAEAAVEEAVRLGVADRSRLGVMGHSHGGLMTATLLAHSDLFRAGIARSGAYNHTIRPFGFQSERRTLWEARDSYLAMMPVMFAPKFNEPVMLIHGAMDENPGTIPFQSERLFEAIRGTGGTARLVMLPYEGHGYLARESVRHVIAEQLAWFDRWVRDVEAPPAP